MQSFNSILDRHTPSLAFRVVLAPVIPGSLAYDPPSLFVQCNFGRVSGGQSLLRRIRQSSLLARLRRKFYIGGRCASKHVPYDCRRYYCRCKFHFVLMRSCVLGIASLSSCPRCTHTEIIEYITRTKEQSCGESQQSVTSRSLTRITNLCHGATPRNDVIVVIPSQFTIKKRTDIRVAPVASASSLVTR